jgi:hypothetical protein
VLDVVNHPWCKRIKLADVMHRNVKPALKPNPFIMYFEQFDHTQLKQIRGNCISNRFGKRNTIGK